MPKRKIPNPRAGTRQSPPTRPFLLTAAITSTLPILKYLPPLLVLHPTLTDLIRRPARPVRHDARALHDFIAYHLLVVLYIIIARSLAHVNLLADRPRRVTRFLPLYIAPVPRFTTPYPQKQQSPIIRIPGEPARAKPADYFLLLLRLYIALFGLLCLFRAIDSIHPLRNILPAHLQDQLSRCALRDMAVRMRLGPVHQCANAVAQTMASWLSDGAVAGLSRSAAGVWLGLLVGLAARRPRRV